MTELTRRAWLAGAAAVALGSMPGRAGANPAPRPALRPARRAQSLVDNWGIGVHLAFRNTVYGNTGAVVALVRELGARMIRDRLTPENAAQAQAFQDLAAAGCRTHATMGVFGETDAARMRELVTAAAAMPEVFHSFGGPNEPNAPGRPADWAARTVAHQRLIWDTVRAAPATAAIPVSGPSLHDRVGDLLADFTALGEAGVARYCHHGEFHRYPAGRSPSSGIDQRMTWARAAFGDKTLLCTEGGYNNGIGITGHGMPVPESVSAVYAPRHLLEHYLRGNVFFTYELLDDPEPGEWESHFGLVATPTMDPSSWRPKPAFHAMRRLLALAADPGPVFEPAPLDLTLTGGGPDVRSILLAKRDGSHVLALWRDVDVYDPRAQEPLPVDPVDVTVQLGSAARVELSQPSTQDGPVRTWPATRTVTARLAGRVFVYTIGSGAVQGTTR